MKKNTLVFLLFSIALVFSNCKKDDNATPNGPPPTGENVVMNISAEPGEEIVFTGTFHDDFGLTNINLKYTDWFLDKTITLENSPEAYELKYTFRVPVSAVTGDHIVVLTVNNTSQKSTSFEVRVNLAEPVIYDNVYVVGSFMWWWGWDYPELSYRMYKNEDNPEWFETPLHVWSGYNDLKFLGQLGWEGNNWGLISQANPSQGMINSESSEAILLDDMGLNPAYYMLRFNPSALTYTAEQMIPSIPVQNEMYIVGNGYPGYPELDWNPPEAIPMDGNYQGYGEHIFGISGLEFSDDVSLKLIGQNTGWGPLDIGVEEGGEMNAPISWVKTLEGDGTPDLKFKDQAGTYTVVYDHFAKRIIIWKE